MPERGGTTTQSGIYYQNSIAALFLGRLCDMQMRPTRERVIEVRVEAPAHVDDIIVTYADRHRGWIQAKESIEQTGDVWKTLWRDFEAQRWCHKFGPDDRLVLVIGTYHNKHQDLRKLCARAGGALDYQEWRISLTKSMSSLVDDIRLLLSPEHQDSELLLALLSHIDVWIVPLEQVERDWMPFWMPLSSTDPPTLFRFLRDKVGGHARYRKIFRAPQLLAELLSDHDVSIVEPKSSGVPAYREALTQAYARIEVPGTNLAGSIDELFLWPTLQEAKVNLTRATTFEEDPRYRVDDRRGSIDLRHFPHMTLQRAVVVAGAGFGKTALLTAITYHRAQTNWLPVMIPLPELAESGQTVIEFLEHSVNRQFNVRVPWDYYCDSGRAVILFDGLDELAPHDRPGILKLVQNFSSRYQQAPWLLTVRDATVLSDPVGAKILRIDTLDHDQIVTFATAYQKAGSAVNIDELLSQLQRHPDLRLLARIPLFLALLLATAPPSERLPRRRGDLLEHYLHVILRPAEYKPSVHLNCDPDRLREVAEYLAFMALERGKIGLTEREAYQILRDVKGDATANTYIVDLTVCGLLKRSPNWISFVFPIVQEYLVACYLVQHLPDEVAQKFELAVRRPWAQTLQFALEQHPEADRIVSELLEQPDDAFGTVLRLVARCIVNGAQVSMETRNRIGDRLAQLWTSQSWTIQRNVGELLADGFTAPLPPRVRALLERGWGLGIGGDEIVFACSDSDLTCALLKAFLNQNLEHQYRLHKWQSAVDVIASEALEYYIERVKAENTTDGEIEALASLIRNLSAEHLPTQAYQSVTDDTTLPNIVRLAGYFLGPRPLLNAAFTLVDEIIRAPKAEDKYRVPGWYLAVDALWCGNNPVDRWRAYVCDRSLSEERRLDVLFSLLDSSLEETKQIDILAQLQTDDSVSLDLKHTILLLRAYLGDCDAMNEVTDLLTELSFEDLTMWAMITSQYRLGDVVLAGLRHLAEIPLGPDQRVRIASGLAFGLTLNVELHGYQAWSGSGRVLHPAAPECARMVWEWTSEYDGGVEERLSLLIAACQLGYPGADESLSHELACLIDQNGDFFQDSGSDLIVSTALHALEDVGHSLPLDTLQRCVEMSESNAATAAVTMIASHASEEALAVLLQLHNTRADWHMRDNIVARIEELAGRLGVRLDWDGDRLVRVN